MYERCGLRDGDYAPVDMRRPPPGKNDCGWLQSLMHGIKLKKLDLDDILMLVIIYLLLRKDGDEDLILIIAVLYILGI